MSQLITILEKRIEGARAALLALEDGAFEPVASSLDHELMAAIRLGAFSLVRRMADVGASGDGWSFWNLTEQGPFSELSSLAVQRGFGTCWLTPIYSSQGEFIGILILFCSAAKTPDAGEESLLRLAKELATVTIERRSLSDRVRHQTLHNALTGLPNRHLLEHELSLALGTSARTGRPVAFLNINLDCFRTVNDAFGYEIGDFLLVQVSKRLQDCLPEADTLGHVGADEFGVVIAELESIGDAALSARTVLDALAPPFVMAGRELRMTASVGISVYPQDGNHGATLRRNADAAMCRAKQGGRNRYEFYTPNMNTAVRERIELASDLRRAIDQNELELHYQPQVGRVGELIGFEALLRWRHPTRGQVPPVQFIPIAEETGLILSIGQWVLFEACRQCKVWQSTRRNRVRVAVNVSAVQFAQPEFPDMVIGAIRQFDLNPNCLELEITESLLVGDSTTAAEKLKALRAAGVRIAIDDFGTGYSSLAYLHQLPIDSLKIDRTFVSTINTGASTDVSGTAIVRAVTALALELGLIVTAEGVETPEQQKFLRKIGCHQLQGHLFGKPQAATDALALLQD